MSLLWIPALSLCLISQSMDISGLSVISVKAGESVSLNCQFVKILSIDRVVWYKQIFGEMPQKVGERSLYKKIHISPDFETSGFKMEETEKAISLTIPHVKRDDGGLYYCAILSWENFLLSNGTFVAVSGDGDVKVSVVQRGVLESVPAGASVTLQCSVLSQSRAAELQVLWFRAAPPQSHPQIIYTHHNSSRQCESGSSTHTCVYNFSKNILSLSDTGTYYCAVALCGNILFGNGTPVQLSLNTFPDQSFKGSDSVVISLAVALAVCVVIIFAQAILYSKKRNSVKLQQGSLREKTHAQDRDAVELNYAALNFSERKTKSGRAKQRQPHNTVYSKVIYSPVT